MQTSCLVKASHPRGLQDLLCSQALRDPALRRVTELEPQLKSDILLVQRDDEAWAYNLWEVLFRWSASRLDLEKFSGMLHVWESRMVLYVFNVPRLHKHSQQVDGLHFLCVHPPRARKKTQHRLW